MPKDYRYNPFNDDLEAITITGEAHVIPANSPYVIRLNEVPAKSSPSSLSMTIGGVTASEVAATPAAGEFRPDYSTGADNDSAWNTGLIQFNAADANKIVLVNYQGIGVLASVTSNQYPSWWLDRGDGSDGDFAPTSHTSISGLKQYKSMYIPPGVGVDVINYAKIKCTGSAVIAGYISATGQGAEAGRGSYIETVGETQYQHSGSPGGTGYRAAGGGAGGIGSNGTVFSPAGAGGTCDYLPGHIAGTNELNYLSTYEDTVHLGAGGGGGGARYNTEVGGRGGNGGGTVVILATEVMINDPAGGIFANGADGEVSSNADHVGGGGGGGGGAVIVIARTISNIGKIEAKGGVGGTGYAAGTAGGDGIAFVKELGV